MGWGEGGEGWWGFPYLKILKFLGFLVMWRLGFLVSWFRSFFVSRFRSSKIYQNAISCGLEDIDHIFKLFKTKNTDLHDVRCRSFPINSKLWMPAILGSIKTFSRNSF